MIIAFKKIWFNARLNLFVRRHFGHGRDICMLSVVELENLNLGLLILFQSLRKSFCLVLLTMERQMEGVISYKRKKNRLILNYQIVTSYKSIGFRSLKYFSRRRLTSFFRLRSSHYR